MAFADSTLRNMEKYEPNMRNWSDRMDHPAVRYIMDNSDIAKEMMHRQGLIMWINHLHQKGMVRKDT